VKQWIFNREKRSIVFVIISGITLLLSLFGWLKTTFPFDLPWVAIVLCGIPILIGAVKGLLIHHDIKADVLVSIALIASVLIKEYFAAGEVAFIMAIGTLLEDTTARKARQGIEKLIRLTPQSARVVRSGVETVVPAGQVECGDTLVVLAGETIAVDGIITSGRTSVDQSVMTGESLPVDKTVGDAVTSGTLNQYGTFEMKATKVGEDSSLQRMIHLVEQADANKAPIVSLVDRWATWMVLAAMGTAVITWLVTGQLIRAVTVLVVFCPCAFILATPTAIMAGVGNATKHGILVRSGDALERLSKVKHIAFDKTGTLTYGKPKVIAVQSTLPGMTEEKLLFYAASVEQRSEHPLGRAVLSYYKAAGGVPGEPQEFALHAGLGVQAAVDGRTVMAGKSGLFEDAGIPIPEAAAEAANVYVREGATAIFIGVDAAAAGFIILSDIVREDAEKMVAQLRTLQIKPLLLTGDNPSAARYIADKVGIAKVEANLLPEGKMKVMEEYQKKDEPVCMIGDGINDALALKSAYAGVAMGGIGSDIAVEAADVVLVSDDIQRVPYLFKLSHLVMRKINGNIIFSMSLNFIAIVLSVTGILNPVIGALVHNAGSVAVVINSALILTVKEEKQ
jgi:heavy metal translocating P-type ATPase